MKNIAESVKARLKNISDAKGVDFNFFCLIYFQERFLYRLSMSKYSDNFILKGGFMLHFLNTSEFRPTKDIDFLGLKIKNDSDKLKDIIKEICSLQYEDGVIFDTKSVEASVIKEGHDYEGTRMKFIARLGSVRNIITIDIGFGDTVLPEPLKKHFTGLLQTDNALLNIYPFETVVSEKFEAIVSLNYMTSRMKDFYDIRFIAHNQEFDLTILKKSIVATFLKRSTKLSGSNIIFSDEFRNDRDKQIQWSAFLRRNKIEVTFDFKDVVKFIEKFLAPVLSPSDADMKWDPVKLKWIK